MPPAPGRVAGRPWSCSVVPQKIVWPHRAVVPLCIICNCCYMLLRLPPTHSAVTKYMTRVDYRQRPHALLPARHENSGDHIPHRKWDSRTVYVSSLLSCGFSTLASCFTTDRHVSSSSYILVPYLPFSSPFSLFLPTSSHYIFVPYFPFSSTFSLFLLSSPSSPLIYV